MCQTVKNTHLNGLKKTAGFAEVHVTHPFSGHVGVLWKGMRGISTYYQIHVKQVSAVTRILKFCFPTPVYPTQCVTGSTKM